MKNVKSWLFKALQLLLGLSSLLAISAASVFAAADAYPSKPVRLIIPFPPGAANDVVGRLIATKLTERLGEQVVADNRGGAGSLIGNEMAAKAEPDGYTLLIASAPYTINPAIYKLSFDPVKAFVPIAKVVTGPLALVVHPSVPANSVKELIALAKQKPGQLIWVSGGIGANMHLSIELFKIMANIDFKIVQFKGGGPAIIDLLGGHSHATITALVQALPHIKSGKLRALGTSGKERTVILPHVPTIAEAGVPGYKSVGFWGILAPAGTPEPIVDRLNKELKAILASDEVKKQFLNEGLEVAYQGPTEFGQLIEEEITQWKRVVKEANIKVE